MLIFIIGYMGAGKTTLGKRLAERLNYRFYDLDEMIETSTTNTINDYFEKFGESSFRLKEREILLNHLDDQDTVIATGGGTACYFDNMDLMNQKGITIYVDTAIESIMKRLADNVHHRPILNHISQDQVHLFINEHIETRRKFYLQAQIKVDGDNVDLEELRNFVLNNKLHHPS